MFQDQTIIILCEFFVVLIMVLQQLFAIQRLTAMPQTDNIYKSNETSKRLSVGQSPRSSGLPNLSKNDYHGMTLKQYFMMCDIQGPIQQEFDDDYGSSNVNTPAFTNQPSLRNQNKKIKIKTEAQQDEIQNYHKNNHIKNVPISFDKTIANKYSQITHQKTQHSNSNPKQHHQKQQSKINNIRIPSIPQKNQQKALNRSTLTSFYQLDLKKKKFLQKIKAEKLRIKQLRLSDAFFITKYGSKFDINSKRIK